MRTFEEILKGSAAHSSLRFSRKLIAEKGGCLLKDYLGNQGGGT